MIPKWFPLSTPVLVAAFLAIATWITLNTTMKFAAEFITRLMAVS